MNQPFVLAERRFGFGNADFYFLRTMFVLVMAVKHGRND